MATPDAETLRVLGVDDLALRRGCAYATILVNLETHAPIDLVRGRDAAVLADWLQAHPGAQIIVRDRSEAYAQGARVAAPDAQQVADRFHLVQNAGAALDEMLRGRRRQVELETDAQAAGDTGSRQGAQRSRRRDRRGSDRPRAEPPGWPAGSACASCTRAGWVSGSLRGRWRSRARRCVA